MVRLTMILRNFILLVILMNLVSGCLNNEWQEKEQHEKDLIQAYLSDHGITEEQKTEGGIYFVEERAGTGITPVKDDYVVINYVGRYIEDNEIHETSYDSLSEDWAALDYYTYYVFGPLKFKYGYSIAGINEGLSLMKEGGKATLVVPSDKAYYDFNPLVYEIELIKVIKDPIDYEKSVWKEYMAVKGYDTITTAYKDIYYKETFTPDPNDQNTAATGDTIIFWFTGRLVDGFGPEVTDERVFDANKDVDEDPIRYKIGESKAISGQILGFPDGLRTAMDTLRTGTHATYVLPYSTAFGEDGLFSTNYGYTIVPEYQTVVYEIVVEDIRPGSK